MLPVHVLRDWGNLSVHPESVLLAVKSGVASLGNVMHSLKYLKIGGFCCGQLKSCLGQVASPGVNSLPTDPSN